MIQSSNGKLYFSMAIWLHINHAICQNIVRYHNFPILCIIVLMDYGPTELINCKVFSLFIVLALFLKLGECSENGRKIDPTTLFSSHNNFAISDFALSSKIFFFLPQW